MKERIKKKSLIHRTMRANKRYTRGKTKRTKRRISRKKNRKSRHPKTTARKKKSGNRGKREPPVRGVKQRGCGLPDMDDFPPNLILDTGDDFSPIVEVPMMVDNELQQITGMVTEDAEGAEPAPELEEGNVRVNFKQVDYLKKRDLLRQQYFVHLGSGYYGNVWSGQYDGQPCAVKVASMYSYISDQSEGKMTIVNKCEHKATKIIVTDETGFLRKPKNRRVD